LLFTILRRALLDVLQRVPEQFQPFLPDVAQDGMHIQQGDDNGCDGEKEAHNPVN
jgi:hypothetical protein